METRFHHFASHMYLGILAVLALVTVMFTIVMLTLRAQSAPQALNTQVAQNQESVFDLQLVTAEDSNTTNMLKERIAIKQKAIETAFPALSDFVSQGSMAGRDIRVYQDANSNDMYFVYATLGSGVPIASASCFRVDQDARAYRVGEFPLMTDSYSGYTSINPRNCTGVR